jgi:hypothetical protein
MSAVSDAAAAAAAPPAPARPGPGLDDDEKKEPDPRNVRRKTVDYVPDSTGIVRTFVVPIALDVDALNKIRAETYGLRTCPVGTFDLLTGEAASFWMCLAHCECATEDRCTTMRKYLERHWYAITFKLSPSVNAVVSRYNIHRTHAAAMTNAVWLSDAFDDPGNSGKIKWDELCDGMPDRGTHTLYMSWKIRFPADEPDDSLAAHTWRAVESGTEGDLTVLLANDETFRVPSFLMNTLSPAWKAMRTSQLGRDSPSRKNDHVDLRECKVAGAALDAVHPSITRRVFVTWLKAFVMRTVPDLHDWTLEEMGQLMDLTEQFGVRDTSAAQSYLTQVELIVPTVMRRVRTLATSLEAVTAIAAFAKRYAHHVSMAVLAEDIERHCGLFLGSVRDD